MWLLARRPLLCDCAPDQVLDGAPQVCWTWGAGGRGRKVGRVRAWEAGREGRLGDLLLGIAEWSDLVGDGS